MLLVVSALLLAGAYVHSRWVKGVEIPEEGASGGSQLVKVNESVFSIYMGDLEPRPSLSAVSMRLYAPGLGHADGALSLSPKPGILISDNMFPGTDLEYHDLNNDSLASNGDFFSVISENGPLRVGIWHVELLCPGSVTGNTTFRINILPPGVQSIVEDAMVAFIDVGQGDAALIRTSDGKHVLIDAGPPGAEAELLAFLGGRSVTSLDALIITHPDADHLGGADDVLRALEVRSVYHPGLVRTTVAYERFIDAARDEGCPIHTGDDVRAGDYLDISVTEDFRVLSINASSEPNDASIVIRMTSMTRSFLFTGDIGFEIEDVLISAYRADLDVDVLKVAHHGSRWSTSAAFLSVVTPSIAVIEVGENSYGHPTDDVLGRLGDVNAIVLRTDLDGDQVILSKGGVFR